MALSKAMEVKYARVISKIMSADLVESGISE